MKSSRAVPSTRPSETSGPPHLSSPRTCPLAWKPAQDVSDKRPGLHRLPTPRATARGGRGGLGARGRSALWDPKRGRRVRTHTHTRKNAPASTWHCHLGNDPGAQSTQPCSPAGRGPERRPSKRCCRRPGARRPPCVPAPSAPWCPELSPASSPGAVPGARSRPRCPRPQFSPVPGVVPGVPTLSTPRCPEPSPVSLPRAVPGAWSRSPVSPPRTLPGAPSRPRCPRPEPSRCLELYRVSPP